MKSGSAVIIGRPNSGKSTLLNARTLYRHRRNHWRPCGIFSGKFHWLAVQV